MSVKKEGKKRRNVDMHSQEHNLDSPNPKKKIKCLKLNDTNGDSLYNSDVEENDNVIDGTNEEMEVDNKHSDSTNNITNHHDDEEMEKHLSEGNENNNENKLNGDTDDDSDSEDESSSDSSEADETPPVNTFSGEAFRKSLSSPNAIENLYQLLIAPQGSVFKYIEAGGTALEIMRLLDVENKKDFAAAATVFQILQLVIIEIVSNFPQKIASTEESCRYLINNFMVTIQSMLGASSTHKNRTIVLKLLTAIVTSSATLGKEIFSQLNLHSEVADALTANTNSSEDKANVRNSFIHFLMSFLVDGNLSLIRVLLDKKYVLSSIFSGLIHDSADTILLVLQTIKIYVVENMGIPRTAKLYTFSTRSLLHLTKLYNWKGPRVFKKTKNLFSDVGISTTVVADPQEQEMVRECIHELLLLVCTSHRRGVIFHDRTVGTGGTRCNMLINGLMQGMDNPWESDKPAELVLKIIMSCPDLFYSYIKDISLKLTLRSSEKFQKVIDFLKKLFQSLNPDIIKPHAQHLSMKQLLTVTGRFCIPHEISSKVNEGITHSELCVRHKVLELLNVMLEQYIKYTQAIESWNILNSSDLQQFKNSLNNYVAANLPTTQNILESFNLISLEVVEPDGDDTVAKNNLLIPKKFDYLETFVDFWLKYSKSCPSLFESLTNKIDANKLLQEINKHSEEPNFPKVQLKCLQWLFNLDNSLFSPDKDLYEKQLPLVFNLYASQQKDIQVEAKKLLYKFFEITGIFEVNQIEIDFWLYSYLLTDSKHQVQIAGFLKDSLINVFKNSYKYVNKISEFQEEFSVSSKHNFRDIFDNLENNYSYVINCELNTLGALPLCALEIFKNQYPNDAAVEKYLSTVLVFLFHSQGDSNLLLNILKDCNLKIYDKYFTSWSSGSKPVCLKKPFGSKSIFSVLSKVLLADESVDILNIFGCKLKDSESSDNEIIYKINGKDVVMETNHEPIQILCSIQLSIFYLSQLYVKDELNQSKVNNILEICIFLLDFFEQYLTNVEFSSKSNQLLYERALKSIFMNPILLEMFTPFPRKKQVSEKLITDFLFAVVSHVVTTNKDKRLINPYLKNYRFKLLNKIHAVIQKCIKKEDSTIKSDNMIEIIEILEFQFEDCEKLLNSILQLNYKYFVSNENEISIWCQILSFILGRISELKTLDVSYCLSNDLIKMISNIYIDVITKLNVEINLDVFEDSLSIYIQSFPHHLEIIGENMFREIFNSKRTTKVTAKLAASILERDCRQLSVFGKAVTENNNLTKKELIFPLLNASLKQNYFNPELLQIIYKEYESNIMKVLEKPQKIGQIYKDNILSVTALIEHCMDLKNCQNFTDKLHKFDVAEIFHLKIIHAVYIKVAKNSSNDKCIVNYFITILQLLNACLKREVIDFEKIDVINQHLFKWIRFLEIKNVTIKSNEILKNGAWATFYKFALKFGMRNYENNDIKTKDKASDILLRILAELSNLLYEKDSKEAAVIFEMALSHSEFLNIMLGQETDSKTNLLHLMFVLANKNNTVMNTSHVPFLLGAYHATLTQSDRYILGLLHLYEKSDVSLYQYRPFLWGESAVHHYSVRSSYQNTLTHQPTMGQILDLLDEEMVNNTVRYFPIWRSMDASLQVKIEDLDDSLFKEFNTDINSEVTNEKCIDTAVELSKIALLRDLDIIKTENVDHKMLLKIVTKQLLENSPLKAHLSYITHEKVYDPAFILPLLGLLLAPEAKVTLNKANTTGATALVWGALGSQHADTRGAACYVLQRLRGHIDAQRSAKDKPLWLQFIDGARYGINNIINNDSKDLPAVSAVSSVFLSRVSLVITQPLHPLYKSLTNSILAKQMFNFEGVPEMLNLLYSSCVEYKTHWICILELLRDGVKNYIDFKILLHNFAYKFIMEFYNSNLSHRDAKILILSIINNTVKIPAACYSLITGHGLFPWLHGVIDHLKVDDSEDIIRGCISILSNIRYSLNYDRIIKAKPVEDNIDLKNINLDKEHQFSVCLLLKIILRKLPPKMNIKIFERYLLTLKFVSGNCNMFTKSDLEYLISYSNSYVHKLCDCSNYLKYGCKFVESRVDFINKLRSSETDCHVVSVSVYLRDIVIAWKKIKNEVTE